MQLRPPSLLGLGAMLGRSEMTHVPRYILHLGGSLNVNGLLIRKVISV